ncbi:hypothetical protein UY3_00942 [Chelonia mydas]|uniref:Uncharacterized protein n=1 Tax=Chelonia mydas TaxID=8469 RepID=M7BVD3_CHEMY|nr:hypothetical protein UY3_00942 [Chelonia mydas]
MSLEEEEATWTNGFFSDESGPGLRKGQEEKPASSSVQQSIPLNLSLDEDSGLDSALAPLEPMELFQCNSAQKITPRARSSQVHEQDNRRRKACSVGEDESGFFTPTSHVLILKAEDEVVSREDTADFQRAWIQPSFRTSPVEEMLHKVIYHPVTGQ